MIRILHIFHEMNNGGIEHYVMDHYRNIDKSEIQFDFLTSVERDGYFDDEIKAMGGKVHHAYPLFKNPIRNYIDIARIVRENNYSIIHRHTGSAFAYYDLRAARHGGAKHLIMHSHNNRAGNVLMHWMCHYLLRIKCEKLACSKEAGKWLFGKHADFTVMSNGIDCQKFYFNESERELIRSSMNIEDCFVVGHVGRFEEQKNHLFLVQIFSEILRLEPNSILILIGSGDMQPQVEGLARKLGVFEKIRFLGTRNDVENYYHAFDVFLLPSKYEGFGITLLEAQANGLACYTSADVVPKTVNATGAITYLPLTESAKVWAAAIMSNHERNTGNITAIQTSGYDIRTNTNELFLYYKKLSGD